MKVTAHPKPQGRKRPREKALLPWNSCLPSGFILSSDDEQAKATSLSVGVVVTHTWQGGGFRRMFHYSLSCPGHPVHWGTRTFFARHQGHLLAKQLAVSRGLASEPSGHTQKG